MGTTRIGPRDLILSPYLSCPKCGKQEYGVLHIGNVECTRRCRDCFYLGTVPLPQLKKKIVYVDQFAFSNIMKMLDHESKGHERAAADPFWKELFEILSVVCHIQMVACPDSREHQHESLTSPFYKALKLTYEHFSGGVSFEDAETIRQHQVGAIARAWLKNEPPTFDFDPESISHGRLHDWGGRIFITVDGVLPGTTDDLRETRSRVHDGLKEVFERWQREKKPFSDVFAAEKAGYRESLFQGQVEDWHKRQAVIARVLSGEKPWLDPRALEDMLPSWSTSQMLGLKHFFEMQVGTGHAQHKLEEFLRSTAMDEAPFSVIAGAMYASLAKKAASGQKEIPNQGTANDITIVSTLLPYCDAMFIDDKCRALLQDIPREFRIPYPCRLFSNNNRAEFIRYLTQIRDFATKEHLALIEQCYGPDALKPHIGIYGVGEHKPA